MWQVTIPGQPVSWDKAYRTGRMYVSHKGKPVLNADGTQKTINRPVKTDEAQAWQDGIVTLTRLAKPSRWKPTGQLVVTLDFWLVRDIDADNLLKLLLDAVALAIDYDDKFFLPCVRSKSLVKDPKEARVLVTVEEAPGDRAA